MYKFSSLLVLVGLAGAQLSSIFDKLGTSYWISIPFLVVFGVLSAATFLDDPE